MSDYFCDGMLELQDQQLISSLLGVCFQGHGRLFEVAISIAVADTLIKIFSPVH